MSKTYTMVQKWQNIYIYICLVLFSAKYLPESSTFRSLIINNELKLPENTHVDNNSHSIYAIVQQRIEICACPHTKLGTWNTYKNKHPSKH